MKNLTQRTLSLSSGATLLGLIVPMALLSGGCTDPKARFHDFENAAFDAGAVDATFDAAPREVPDPTGTYYVTFVTAMVPPDNETVVNLIWTLTATKDADNRPISVDMTTQTLTTIPNGRVPVGTLTAKTGSPISAGGEFPLEFNDFLLNATANFTSQDKTLDMKLNVVIKSADVFCGTVTDGAVRGLPPLLLAGSTFVGVRVPPGTVGSALPPPVEACPNLDMPPDAGVPDAGIPDAQLPDAS